MEVKSVRGRVRGVAAAVAVVGTLAAGASFAAGPAVAYNSCKYNGYQSCSGQMGQGTGNWAGYGNYLNGNYGGSEAGYNYHEGPTCNYVETGGPNSKSIYRCG
jgi:hypothetical protein